ncbi:MAG: Na(+)/H(+) antiporter subunit D, partial [Woeseiaceae bacterium]
SKSMIMTAMIEHGSDWLWLALLFASAGVFHHAGIKVPYFAFFSHDAGIRVAEAPRNMLIAMALAAIGCIFIGVYPAGLYTLLPWEAGYVPYTYPHVIVQLQLLLFSALAFAWLKLTGIYPPELRSVNLDVDWIYRRFLLRVAQPLITTAASVWLALGRFVDNAAATLSEALHPGKSMRPPLGAGMAALFVSVALAGYLFVYFVSRA